ncbi:hypothetical protein H8R25_03310 [Flavobacterium sp. F-392]|uniref:Uncharacterized protein n=2 Tax=Flavobacterium muglaense TaxID=2764716 RepID=A0A923MYH5_9FLAO|nr:hypothetical protein [Flavobacterium muglaense]MBC5843465.1 hypothetical protein [Flavobacterium muglaense]
MMKKVLYSALPFCCFFLFVFAVAKTNNADATFRLQTTQNSFTAGTPIALTFATASKTATAHLFVIHSYGKTLLTSQNINGQLVFHIPAIYCIKTGDFSWFLIQNNKTVVSGTFVTTPNNTTPTLLENYLGPPSLLTGTEHFTMMVAIPTDSYDNPKDNNTAVYIKDQFLENITTTEKKTDFFIAWKNIYSRTKSGKMLVSTECNNTASKEFETDIQPSPGKNFTINYSRNHKYADGNQITLLETSIIRDSYGNIVGDGTMVTFQVVTTNDILLKTYAATINGIAIAQILHPDHNETFTVKGYVTGIAESNSIKIDYLALIKTFNYEFTEGNRKITVGPVRSFMNQIVPDGIKVELKIYHKNNLIESKIVETAKGIANFYLLAPFYKEKEYQFEISTLGITQKTAIKKYETN